MRVSQMISHRFVDCEDNVAFMLEDGIDVIGGRAAIQTCLNCSHTELLIEEKEAIDPSMCACQKKTQFPTRLHHQNRDLL